MKIESIIKRSSGSKIILDNPRTIYHFKPETTEPEAPHVANVTNKSHIDRLLAIKEGYRSLGKSDDKDDGDTGETVLKGSDWKPEITEFENGDSVATSALVYQAFEASGLDAKDWNKLTNKDIKERLLNEIEVLVSKSSVEADDGAPEEEKTEDAPVLDQVPVKETPKSKAEKKAALEARKLELGQV